MQIATTALSKPLARLWTKNYTLLLAANLFICFGFYMLPPTLPAQVRRLGGSSLESSLVVGIFSVFSLIFRVIGGSAADARGEKAIALFGSSLVLVSTFSFAFLPVKGILALRMLQGLGWGFGTAALATAISASVAPERRGEGIGYYSLTMILALGITPMIAIPEMNASGFPLVVFTSSLLLVAGILALSLSSARGKTAGGTHRAIDWKNLFERRALLPSSLCFLLNVTTCGIVIYMMLYGEEIGVDSVWLFFAGFIAMALVTRPFIGRIFDKRGHSIIVLPGSLLVIAGLLSLSYARSAIGLLPAAILYGLGYGAVQPSLQAWAIGRSPAERRGAANGTFLSAMDLSYTLGSMILGAISSRLSFAFMYRISALFVVAMLIIYVAANTRSRE